MAQIVDRGFRVAECLPDTFSRGLICELNRQLALQARHLGLCSATVFIEAVCCVRTSSSLRRSAEVERTPARRPSRQRLCRKRERVVSLSCQ